MEVERIVVGAFRVNCYVLVEDGQALVVDPGDEADRILETLDDLGVETVRAILLTHGHLDHVMAVGDVHEATDAPVHLHPDDRGLYDAAPEQAAQLTGDPVDAPPAPDGELTPGTFVSGPFELDVLATPGHTPGGVTLLDEGEGRAWVGDVLFAGGIGRTDLGGDRDTLMRSIEEVLFDLPDDTRVLPGHGPPTTIGREKRSNPFVG